MPIDGDEVRRVARLARLEIDDAEVERYARDLSRVVELLDSLKSVVLPEGEADTDDGGYFDSDVHREDRTGPCLDRDEALLNAPETDGEFFFVPRIVKNAADVG